MDRYNVKAIIAVVPDNDDCNLKIDAPDDSFWSTAQSWSRNGHEIALHGYDHVYITDSGGMNPIHQRSEFAGVSLSVQIDKIKKGYEILSRNGLVPNVFVAPSHTFDENTLTALKANTSIKVISDTFALSAYLKNDFVFLPQQFGGVRSIPIGMITFCYHPNTMTENSFEALEYFIKENAHKFIAFTEIDLISIKANTLLDRILSKLYFKFREYRRYWNKK